MTGRRTILDEALSDSICTWLAQGATYTVAAQASGVSDRSIYGWLSRGRAELERMGQTDPPADGPATTEAPFVRFLHATEEARAAAEVEALAIIREHMRGFDATETRTEERPGRDEEGNPVTITVTTTTTKPVRSWQASAWMLERTRPDRYARVSRVEGGDIPVAVEGRMEVTDDRVATDSLGAAAVFAALVEGGIVVGELFAVGDDEGVVAPEADAIHAPYPNGEADRADQPGGEPGP